MRTSGVISQLSMRQNIELYTNSDEIIQVTMIHIQIIISVYVSFALISVIVLMLEIYSKFRKNN